MLRDIIRAKINSASVIFRAGFASNDKLVDLSFDKHFRVDQGNNAGACSHRQINGN